VSEDDGLRRGSSSDRSPSKELVSSLSSEGSCSTVRMSEPSTQSPVVPETPSSFSERRAPAPAQKKDDTRAQSLSQSDVKAKSQTEPSSPRSNTAPGSDQRNATVPVSIRTRPTHSPKSSISHPRQSHSRTASASSATNVPPQSGSDDRTAKTGARSLSPSHSATSPNPNLVGRAVEVMSSGARGFLGAIWGP